MRYIYFVCRISNRNHFKLIFSFFFVDHFFLFQKIINIFKTIARIILHRFCTNWTENRPADLEKNGVRILNWFQLFQCKRVNRLSTFLYVMDFCHLHSGNLSNQTLFEYLKCFLCSETHQSHFDICFCFVHRNVTHNVRMNACYHQKPHVSKGSQKLW